MFFVTALHDKGFLMRPKLTLLPPTYFLYYYSFSFKKANFIDQLIF